MGRTALLDRLKPDRQEIGKRAEAFAAQWLKEQGLHLVTRNYRCRVGEIDLVLRDNATLVFTEVRHRSGHAFGSGAESVDRRKQEKLIRAAEHYLQQHHPTSCPPCRFDVVDVCAGDTPGSPEALYCDWIQAAFDA